jgi:hypothetical protein
VWWRYVYRGQDRRENEKETERKRKEKKLAMKENPIYPLSRQFLASLEMISCSSCRGHSDDWNIQWFLSFHRFQ